MPVDILEGPADAAFLLLCDHASNALPQEYGTLGLAEAELRRHIAYDIGAAGLTRLLAARLGAPAVLSRYSRLLIDINRGEDDPTLIMRLSDGAVIPGNAAIDDAERAKRIASYYRPYHDAVAAAVARALPGGAPVVLSLHSFTPEWRGRSRPWHVGILWDKDPRFAQPLIAALRARQGLIVGDNEPYSGRLKNDTLYKHATRNGLAHALIEVRQDLIADEAGRQKWSGVLADAVLEARASPGVAQACVEVRHFGSHADEAQPAQAAAPAIGADRNLDVELEAAVLRRLVEHLRARPEVQNIDLMNLAGFCRNCLANWRQEAAAERGLAMTKEQARETVYGMPYEEWRARHQREATAEQLSQFASAKPSHD